MRLRPVSEYDQKAIWQLACQTDVTARWRSDGRALTRERFLELAFADTALSSVVERAADGRLIGLAQCYGFEPRHGRAYATAFAHPAFHRSVAVGEAWRLFVTHAFAVLPIRKLCAEVPEWNWTSLLRKGRLPGWRHEGTLVGHQERGGRHWDVALFAVWRTDLQS